MKKIIVVLICLVFLCGCNEKAKDATARANMLSGGYKKQLDKTTPEQDKAHIRAMDYEIFSIDAAMRGIGKAKKTRALVAPEDNVGGK